MYPTLFDILYEVGNSLDLMQSTDFFSLKSQANSYLWCGRWFNV